MPHTRTAAGKPSIRVAITLIGALLATTSANATTVTYNFANLTGSSSSSDYGNVTTFSQFEATLGLTMKVTGWATTGTGTGVNRRLQSTYVPQFQYAGYGLGNCNRLEGTDDCSSNLPTHQTDNVGGVYEFVMFQFDTPISPASITINPYNPTVGYDRDVTVFMGTTTYGQSLTNLQISSLAGLGLTNRQDFNSTVSEDPLMIALTSPVKINTILVAARLPGGTGTVDGTADRFKLDSVSVVMTPEPGTFALVGLALVGFGLARRRPKAS